MPTPTAPNGSLGCDFLGGVGAWSAAEFPSQFYGIADFVHPVRGCGQTQGESALGIPVAQPWVSAWVKSSAELANYGRRPYQLHERADSHSGTALPKRPTPMTFGLRE